METNCEMIYKSLPGIMEKNEGGKILRNRKERKERKSRKIIPPLFGVIQ